MTQWEDLDDDAVVRNIERLRAEARDIEAGTEAMIEHAANAWDRAVSFEEEQKGRNWTVDIPGGIGTITVDASGHLVDVTLDPSLRQSDTTILGERIQAAMQTAAVVREQERRSGLDEILKYVGE